MPAEYNFAFTETIYETSALPSADPFRKAPTQRFPEQRHKTVLEEVVVRLEFLLTFARLSVGYTLRGQLPSAGT